jgi:tetratricopeptide (TPR) repeat protein
MRKKILGTICILSISVVLQQSVGAASPNAFIQHYDAAQDFLTQGQYSSAIVEFRKSLRINYMDNSARIGLINSYLARATYYANQEKNYEKSANDFRSALFYLKMYPTKTQAIQNSASMIASANENLNQCLKVVSFDRTASSRYKKAEELRAMGNFSAAAFEFSQAAQNETLAGNANTQIADLMKLLGNESRSADYYKIALDLKPADS